jgi:tetratricopeptide (TPR) repeat protein
MGKLSQLTGVLNDADKLRELIDRCEKALARIDTESVRQLMLDNTAAHRLLDQLIASGADMRAEEARLSSVDGRIIRNAQKIVTQLGGRTELAKFRDQASPGTQARWWWLENELDARRRRTLTQLGIAAGIVAVILLVGYIARPVLFPPDPVGDAINSATIALDRKDMAGVLTAIDLGLKQVPTNTELLIWKGYLEEKAGNQQSATAAYNLALQNAGSDKEFLLQRAIQFVRMGEYQRVLTDTNQLISKYPDLAEAYYMRASGYEGLGQRAQAIADLEKAGELAQAQGNDTLFAQSRVRLANLMQAGP